MPIPGVVLDTNVVVSAHLKQEGFERFVLDLALNHKLELFLSREIFEEYRGVLSRAKLRIEPKRVEASLRLIAAVATMVVPSRRIKVAKDPDDDKFLECAAEAQADYLVTGNRKHFPRNWGATRVVNAREFLQEIAADLRR